MLFASPARRNDPRPFSLHSSVDSAAIQTKSPTRSSVSLGMRVATADAVAKVGRQVSRMSPESHSAAEIPRRLRLVEQEIAFACEASGRSLHAVKLIAVSKTMFGRRYRRRHRGRAAHLRRNRVQEAHGSGRSAPRPPSGHRAARSARSRPTRSRKLLRCSMSSKRSTGRSSRARWPRKSGAPASLAQTVRSGQYRRGTAKSRHCARPCRRVRHPVPGDLQHRH